MAQFLETSGNCPACRAPIVLRRLQSTEGYVAFDLDYRTYARGADPTRLLIQRCPSCQFCEYVTDFFKPVDPAVVALLQSRPYTALLSGQRSSDFPLVALIKETKGEGAERVGYAYLRASWFAADLGQDDEEKHYLQLAASNFVHCLKTSPQTPGDGRFLDSGMVRIQYLLAEINRRLGQFDLALHYANQVESLEFAVLVRDQRNLILRKDDQRRRAKSSH